MASEPWTPDENHRNLVAAGRDAAKLFGAPSSWGEYGHTSGVMVRADAEEIREVIRGGRPRPELVIWSSDRLDWSVVWLLEQGEVSHLAEQGVAAMQGEVKKREWSFHAPVSNAARLSEALDTWAVALWRVYETWIHGGAILRSGRILRSYGENGLEISRQYLEACRGEGDAPDYDDLEEDREEGAYCWDAEEGESRLPDTNMQACIGGELASLGAWWPVEASPGAEVLRLGTLLTATQWGDDTTWSASVFVD